MHAVLSPIGLLPMSSVRKDQENHCLAFCEDLLKDNKPELAIVVVHGKTLRGKPYKATTVPVRSVYGYKLSCLKFHQNPFCIPRAN